MGLNVEDRAGSPTPEHQRCPVPPSIPTVVRDRARVRVRVRVRGSVRVRVRFRVRVRRPG